MLRNADGDSYGVIRRPEMSHEFWYCDDNSKFIVLRRIDHFRIENKYSSFNFKSPNFIFVVELFIKPSKIIPSGQPPSGEKKLSSPDL